MTLFSLKHREFLSTWCTSDLQVWEEDATLDYDPFLASGWVLNLLSLSNPSNITSSEYNLIPNNMPRASYAHQRTSLLVKIIANLHCFIPHICNGKCDDRVLKIYSLLLLGSSSVIQLCTYIIFIYIEIKYFVLIQQLRRIFSWTNFSNAYKGNLLTCLINHPPILLLKKLQLLAGIFVSISFLL